MAQTIETRKHSTAPPSYDQQASTYDKRVGFSELACRQIVNSVLSVAPLQPNDLVVEVGTGTGQIGAWFISDSHRYMGFDLSASMLDEFRLRLGPDRTSSHAEILQADGNQPWPVPDASARIIFSSRAIHLLDLDHVNRECHRLMAPGGTLAIFGRIQRSKDSVRDQMQKQLQRLLKDRGLQGRQGDRRQRKLLDVLAQQGATPIDPIKAVRWDVHSCPQDSLDSWQKKAGLAGNDVSEDFKADVLAQLREWAIAQFGDLNHTVTSEEAYVLQGAWLTI